MRQIISFRKIGCSLLPRWLRRKIGKLKSYCQVSKRKIYTVLLTITVVSIGCKYFNPPDVMAQTSIGNGWDYVCPSHAKVPLNLWWGYDASNNVISHLNNAVTNGTVNVRTLDTADYSHSYFDGTNTVTHSFSPFYDDRARNYSGTGTVTINSGIKHLYCKRS